MPTNERPSLLADDRGAIMVMGIFMCSCLVGAMWYLAGIGDAILYRERMQEAADAMAFSDAALHARGMNLLVLMNLIMAVILAIRVAIRVGKLVCTVAATILAASAIFFPPNAAPAAAAAAAATTLQTIDSSSKGAIDGALNALVTAQAAIQTVAAGAATIGTDLAVGSEYAPVVRHAHAYRVVDVFSTDGLPAEKGTPDKLCREAAGAIGELVSWMLGKIPVVGPVLKPVGTLLQGMMVALASSSPSYFCDLEAGASQPSTDHDRDQAAVDRCKDPDKVRQGEEQRLAELETRWHEECAADNVVCTSVDTNGKTLTDGTQTPLLRPDSKEQQYLDSLRLERDQAARNVEYLKKQEAINKGAAFRFPSDCMAWSLKEAKQHEDDQKAQRTQQTPTTSQGTSGIAPMRVANFRNGAKEGQFIGGVTGDDTLLVNDAKMVRLGTFGAKQTRPLADPAGAKLPAWAQSELYFDCSGAWDGSDCNDDEEAMWSFRWRPRLRRFGLDTDDMLRTLAGFLLFVPPLRGPDAFADDLAHEAPASGGSMTNAALRRDLAESLQDPSVREHGVH
ncbi:MAG: hypothetical protein JWP97_3999 [Labilithrix sp.]|nr:hypothetical protein [Labilithrix sp.]